MYRDIFITPEMSDWQKETAMDDVAPGFSPGYAGAFLGMSRQAVDKAVRKGALIATRVYQVDVDGHRSHLATIIDHESMLAYRDAKSGRERVPQGFRANQLRLIG